MNTITEVGNLTDAPQLRYSSGGVAVATFTIAVDRRYRDENGQWRKDRDGFFRCVAFRNLAEATAEQLDKGSHVIVTGILKENVRGEGQDKQSRLEINVTYIGRLLT